MSGWWRWKAASKSHHGSNVCGNDSRKRPFRRAWSLTTACSASSSASMPRAACSYSLVPASVSFVPRAERASNCTLSCRSRSRIRRLSVGSGVPRRVAAAERLPAWTTATNMRVAFRSMQKAYHIWKADYQACPLISIFDWSTVPPMTKTRMRILAAAMSLVIASSVASAQTTASSAEPVTVENYNRAQTDVNFAGVVKNGGFGRFRHGRELAPSVQQGIGRPNRDTLYSFAIVDLDAGPVTITLPDAGKRFMGMQVINQDQYTLSTYYAVGTHTLTREMIGTRYAIAVVRFLVDPSNKEDVGQVHALQDSIKFSQEGPGTFEIPNWDEASLKKVRAALLQLGTTVSDTRRMFGANENEVDPVRHLIGSAMLWGGYPEKDALYLPITPARNDGSTIHKLTVGNVPVDGFWSLTVYNSEGYLQPNQSNVYSVNSITAKKSADGAITIQFGGCDDKIQNCLPITQGWNYAVRLFLPRAEIIDGTWLFPLAQPES